MLPDTWFAQDLPVLEAAVRLLDEGTPGGPRVGEIADAVGIDPEAALVSLRRLEAKYVELVVNNPASRATRVVAVTAEARHAVGQWPTPEAAVDRLLALLEEKIAAEPEGSEQRGRLQALRDGAAGVGRELLIAYITRAVFGS